MPFQEDVDGEVTAAHRGHESLCGVDVALADLLVGAPRPHGAGRVDGVGAQGGRVRERDDQVCVRPQHPVDLAEHTIEVVDDGKVLLANPDSVVIGEPGSEVMLAPTI